MSFNRTYQGKITAAYWVSGKKFDRDNSLILSNWQKPLDEHLKIHHCAINYYLACFAACAKGSEEKSLVNLYNRVKDSWEGHTYRCGGRGPGFRDSLTQYLPHLISKTTSFDDACELLINREDKDTTKLNLALEALLNDLGGEGSIQQGGRSYLPYFCDPKTTANYPRNALVLQKNNATLRIPKDLHSYSPEEFHAKYEVHHIVKLDNTKNPLSGGELKKKLEEFINHLAKEAFLTAKQKEQWNKQIESLDLDLVSIPAYNGASAKGDVKNRLYAFILFKVFPIREETFKVLRSTYPELKEETDKPKKVSEEKQRTVDLEARLNSLGDDPIFLSRGSRDYTFKAFSTHIAQSNSTETPPWKEFDISAFKQALLTLNQIEQKVTERLDALKVLKKQISYFETKKGSPYNSDEPVSFKDDPRFDLWKPLREELVQESNSEFDSYAIGWGTIKGWPHLREQLKKHLLKHPSATQAELKKEVLDLYQSKNKNIGSVLLFHTLLKPEYHDFWREISESEIQKWHKHDWSHDFLSDVVQYEQVIKERDHLEENLEIKITPAHLKRSRRPIMLSDLGGSSKVVHLDRPNEQSSLITSVYTKTENSQVFEQKRIELVYSAPRLLRDNLTGKENRNLLQPLLKGLNLTAPDISTIAEKAKSLPVALMPDWVSGSDNKQPDRLLLNFPATLETDWIAEALGKAHRWDKQFNGVKDELLHLHWPNTAKTPALENAWWKNPNIIKNGFTLTSVDLGLKTAASYTTLHVVGSIEQVPESKKKFSRLIGTTNERHWYAYPLRRGGLHLPGEGGKTLRPIKSNHQNKTHAFQPELGGSKGRKATDEETQEYLETITHFSSAAEWLQKKAKDNTPVHFPEQNDDLLKLARQVQGNLSEQHNVLQLSKDSERLSQNADILNAKQKERIEKALAFASVEKQSELALWIHNEQQQLKQLIIDAANRILPQRKFDWDIEEGATLEIESDSESTAQFTKFSLKRLVRHTSSGKKIQGQRGISAPRIEQLEELRRRMASLQRELNREPGKDQSIGFGKHSHSIPEPAQEILAKIDNLKEQRVKQTAHLILAQALGLRLKKQKTPKSARADYVHGEYEPIPNATTSDFIVIEDLTRYRTRADRSRSENRKLMQWAHRAIAETLKELAQIYGIPVLTTAASYSSRFCAITGRPGFRAIEINRNRLDHPALKYMLKEGSRIKESEEAAQIKESIESYPEISNLNLIVPMDGGPLFVPCISESENRDEFPVTQADTNAAHNLGLRAIAAPEQLDLIHKIRTESNHGKIIGKMDNIREKAVFDQRSSISPADAKAIFSKEITSKKFSNFFTLPDSPTSKVHFPVEFDLAQLTLKNGKTIALASSYGIWTSVNHLKLANTTKLNQTILKKLKIPLNPHDTEDQIPM